MGKFIRLTGFDNGSMVRVAISRIIAYQNDNDSDGSVIDCGTPDGAAYYVKETPEEIDALIEQAERS